MKMNIVKIQRPTIKGLGSIDVKGYLVTIRYTPGKIYRFFGAKEKHLRFFSEYGAMWYNADTLEYIKPLSKERILLETIYERAREQRIKEIINSVYCD